MKKEWLAPNHGCAQKDIFSLGMNGYAWLGILLGLLLFGGALYWLLITTEGVYLGRRVVVWLYDLAAKEYDNLKAYDPRDERLLVARPVLRAVQGLPEPVILDVATGTGRVPLDLMREPSFRGRVVGLDDSRKMLAVAKEKLAPFAERVALLRHPAVPLPFPDEHFDAVSCLEALEFFPSDRAALREMVRVLRPGGTLFTTRRCGWEGKAFLHRYRSQADMEALLEELGLAEIVFHVWEINYNLVTARKPGKRTRQERMRSTDKVNMGEDGAGQKRSRRQELAQGGDSQPEELAGE